MTTTAQSDSLEWFLGMREIFTSEDTPIWRENDSDLRRMIKYAQLPNSKELISTSCLDRDVLFSLLADTRCTSDPISTRCLDKIWMDSRYAFILRRVLTKGWYPVCFVSFYYSLGGLHIEQLQGVEGEKEDCKRLGRWEKLLINIVEDYAKFDEIKEVSILPAAENHWVKRGNISLKTAKLRYDVTAKRCGYKYDEKEKIFVKEIVF